MNNITNIINNNSVNIASNITTNIYINSAGLLFPYLFGVLSYIKHNINITNYNLYGSSAGSWLTLLYHFESDLLDYEKLWTTYIGNKNSTFKLHKNLADIPVSLRKNMLIQYNNKNITQLPVSIVVINVDKFFLQEYKTNFTNLEDILSICECSSYIPFISGKKFYISYNNIKYIDGGLFTNLKKNNGTNNIYIHKHMWDRKFNISNYIYLDYNSAVKLYKLGWKDTEKNKDFIIIKK
jgi:hypothetical protein